MHRWPSFSFEHCLNGISWANLFMILVSIPKTPTGKPQDKEQENEVSKQLEAAGF